MFGSLSTSPGQKEYEARVAAMPKYEDLHKALPGELQSEFEELANSIIDIVDGPGSEIQYDSLSPIGKAKLDRYRQLTKMATDIIQETKGIISSFKKGVDTLGK